MDAVTVFVAKALICFAGQCHPALVGHDTIPGTYDMSILYTQQRGYGGDVLMYDSDDRSWNAIHSTYTLDPRREREELYLNTSAAERTVTAGCVNVEPEIYQDLRDNYRNLPLIINP